MRANLKVSRSYVLDIGFLLVFSIVFLYFLGLFSYNPTDNSINSAQFPELATKNLAGSWGASLSAYAIYFLGFGSCLVPVPFFLMGIAYFRGNLTLRLSFLFVLSTLLFYTSLSYVFGTFFPFFQFYEYEISTLGKLGFKFKSNFYENLGRFGAPTVAFTLCVAAILIFSTQQLSLKKVPYIQKLFNRK